jgi:phage shock protein PspC (stress-responsive transcriptional regulator)
MRLTRSKKDRLIGGVCAGVANALDMEPALIRVIWAVLLLSYGIGLVPYLILWAILPEE